MPLIPFKSSSSDVAHIIQLLSQYYNVSDELAEEFYKHAFSVKIEKGEHILFQGEICKAMYFIKEGAVLAYSKHHHKQITTYISVENEFISSLSGLYGQEPSREALIAIEPCTLLGIHTDILLGWYERFFELNYIIRKVYENYYRDAQERSFIVRIGNAKERYQYFLNSRPYAAERLPVEHLAAFLDMKPETLVRIKKQGKKESSQEDVLQIIKHIDDYIITKKAFKSKEINASILSKSLKIPLLKISQSLKIHYKLGFTDYVNRHRINYFKQTISKHGHLQNYTIEAIALNAGFVSRSGFYKAFKKFEGISPREYAAGIKPV